MSSSTDTGPFVERVSRRPSGVSEVQNGDFLSRLLAATPPYLHNTALLPPGLVFSEMLKSLVAKPSPSISLVSEEEGTTRPSSTTTTTNPSSPVPTTAPQPPPPPPPPPMPPQQVEFWLPKTEPSEHRHRKRKRCWRDTDDSKEGTSGIFLPKCSPPPKEEAKLPLAIPDGPILPPFRPPFGPLPELPPPPPRAPFGPLFPRVPPPGMWYPALYPGFGPGGLPPLPPYAIDPLHFFIDLRVSGHIWDRQPLDEGGSKGKTSEAGTSKLPKLEGMRLPPHDGDDPLPGKSSAFSVPEPRGTRIKVKDSPEASGSVTPEPISPRGTHYIMQNLSKIYNGLKPGPVESEVSDNKEQEEGKEKSNCKDLPALIGLELVVDYVQQHEGKRKTDDNQGSSSEGQVEEEQT